MAAQLGKAGFDEAMIAALAARGRAGRRRDPGERAGQDRSAPRCRRREEEPDPEEKDGKAAAGAPHVLITRTPDGRLTFLQAIGSRRKGAVAAGVPASFTGLPDHRRLHRLPAPSRPGSPASSSAPSTSSADAGRSRNSAPAACRTGPATSSPSCATPIRPSRTPAPAADTALDQQVLDDLRERYDTAAAFGITHNRLRDWHDGNHPGYALGCWLRDYKEQVFLFTRDFAVNWTNNVSERGAKAAKRHQAVSGYWHESRCPDSCHYAEAEVMPRLVRQPWLVHGLRVADAA